MNPETKIFLNNHKCGDSHKRDAALLVINSMSNSSLEDRALILEYATSKIKEITCNIAKITYAHAVAEKLYFFTDDLLVLWDEPSLKELIGVVDE